MSEISQTNLEQHRLPVFAEQEAQAILSAQESIKANRIDLDGNIAYREGMSGVTEDGLFISVEERLVDHPFVSRPDVTVYGDARLTADYVVRTARVSDLAAGAEMTQETPERSIKLRSGGPTVVTSFGMVSYDKEVRVGNEWKKELPALHVLKNSQTVESSCKIYPIGADGQPFDPSQNNAEEAVVSPLPETVVPQVPDPLQVTTRGLRGFLKRRK